MWMEISATWQVLLSPTYNGSSCCLLIILLNWTTMNVLFSNLFGWNGIMAAISKCLFLGQASVWGSWAKRLFEGLGPSVCLRVMAFGHMEQMFRTPVFQVLQSLTIWTHQECKYWSSKWAHAFDEITRVKCGHCGVWSFRRVGLNTFSVEWRVEWGIYLLQ